MLRIRGQYFRLSLRMMKSIWRHVRLKKGFVNVERAPYGGLKLKIPTLLLTEKMRTQSRFNVSHSAHTQFPLLKQPPWQMMRMELSAQQSKERKHSQNASSKIHQTVQKVLVPLLGAPMSAHVSFRAAENLDVGRDLLEHLRESAPEAVRDRGHFLRLMGEVYDTYAPPSGSSRTPESSPAPPLVAPPPPDGRSSGTRPG